MSIQNLMLNWYEKKLIISSFWYCKHAIFYCDLSYHWWNTAKTFVYLINFNHKKRKINMQNWRNGNDRQKRWYIFVVHNKNRKKSHSESLMCEKKMGQINSTRTQDLNLDIMFPYQEEGILLIYVKTIWNMWKMKTFKRLICL